ncbi:MAG: hypothetical protein IKI20_03490 [Lachnospiraceae bacterium]|nr:hypothetical protein [Lachnospiraceae bacterium]
MDGNNAFFEKMNVSEDEINSFIKERFDPELKTTRAEELLNEKYNLNFEISQYCGHFESYEAYRVFAYEKNHPDITFEAIIGDVEDYVDDSYASKCICHNMANYLEEQIDYKESFFYFYVESLPVILPTKDYKMDFKKLAEEFPKNKYSIYLFLISKDGIEKTVGDDIIDNLFKKIPQFSGYFNLYSIPESKEKEVLQYLSTRTRIYSDFTIEYKDRLVYRKAFSNGTVH